MNGKTVVLPSSPKKWKLEDFPSTCTYRNPFSLARSMPYGVCSQDSSGCHYQSQSQLGLGFDSKKSGEPELNWGK